MPAPRKPKKALVHFAIALLVAAGLGIVAVVIGYTVISSANQNAKNAQIEAEKKIAEAEAEAERLRDQQRQSVKIKYKMVLAATDIQPGQPITREMLELVESEDRPEPGTLNHLSQVVGKMVKAPVVKGDPMHMSRLLDGDFIHVAQGMRAITINVDSIGGLSGALTPGAHVDVLTTLSNEDKTIARTLLQNVLVLAAGNSPAAPDAGGKSSPQAGGAGPVTLSVTPKQAELLTLANRLGVFHLTLRNFSDKNKAGVKGTDLTELVTGISADSLKRQMPSLPPEPMGNGLHNVNFSPNGNLPSPAPDPATSKFTMKIFRGTNSDDVEFER